jgi:hypothetical protein
VVAASFLLGALAIMALVLKLPPAALLAIVALVGIGTSLSASSWRLWCRQAMRQRRKVSPPPIETRTLLQLSVQD